MRDFTPSEEVDIWRSLESRQGENYKKYPDLRSNLDQSEQPKLRAAKITGTSPATLSKAKQVGRGKNNLVITYIKVKRKTK